MSFPVSMLGALFLYYYTLPYVIFGLSFAIITQSIMLGLGVWNNIDWKLVITSILFAPQDMFSIAYFTWSVKNKNKTTR